MTLKKNNIENRFQSRKKYVSFGNGETLASKLAKKNKVKKIHNDGWSIDSIISYAVINHDIDLEVVESNDNTAPFDFLIKESDGVSCEDDIVIISETNGSILCSLCIDTKTQNSVIYIESMNLEEGVLTNHFFCNSKISASIIESFCALCTLNRAIKNLSTSLLKQLFGKK